MTCCSTFVPTSGWVAATPTRAVGAGPSRLEGAGEGQKESVRPPCLPAGEGESGQEFPVLETVVQEIAAFLGHRTTSESAN